MRELVTFNVENIEYHLTLATTEIIIGGNSERLISLQDIQSELDATQAQAWEELVRVLTHEIMNSITPVTSRAQTASELVEDVVSKTDPDAPAAQELEDVQSAVATVARRSNSQLVASSTSFNASSKACAVEPNPSSFAPRTCSTMSRSSEM